MAISSDRKVLYAATEGEGVFRLGEIALDFSAACRKIECNEIAREIPLELSYLSSFWRSLHTDVADESRSDSGGATSPSVRRGTQIAAARRFAIWCFDIAQTDANTGTS